MNFNHQPFWWRLAFGIMFCFIGGVCAWVILVAMFGEP